MNAVEQWRPVAGYEGLYEVSDQGRVRRLPGQCAFRAGVGGYFTSGVRWFRGGVLKNSVGPRGYARVSLYRDHRFRAGMVHLLVARAFLGPAPEGHDANHKNGDRMDARLQNLEYLTTAANIVHGWRELGRLKRCNARYEAIASTAGTHHNTGERNGLAKLNAAVVREMREMYATGRVTTREVAAHFHIAPVTAFYAIARRTWRHVE